MCNSYTRLYSFLFLINSTIAITRETTPIHKQPIAMFLQEVAGNKYTPISMHNIPAIVIAMGNAYFILKHTKANSSTHSNTTAPIIKYPTFTIDILPFYE